MKKTLLVVLTLTSLPGCSLLTITGPRDHESDVIVSAERRAAADKRYLEIMQEYDNQRQEMREREAADKAEAEEVHRAHAAYVQGMSATPQQSTHVDFSGKGKKCGRSYIPAWKICRK